jgi:hypothetical protein
MKFYLFFIFFFGISCKSSQSIEDVKPEVTPEEIRQFPALEAGWELDRGPSPAKSLAPISVLATWSGSTATSMENATRVCNLLCEDFDYVEAGLQGIVARGHIDNLKAGNRIPRTPPNEKHTCFVVTGKNPGGGTYHTCFLRLEKKS